MKISSRSVIFVLSSRNVFFSINAFKGASRNFSVLNLHRTFKTQQQVRKIFEPQLQDDIRSLSSLGASSIYKDTADELPPFQTQEEYTEYLVNASTLPKGFATGSAEASFVPNEAPSMGSLPIKGTIIHLVDGPTDSWAATFTENKFPGSPIIVGRSRLSSGKPIQTLIINNKISNVCSAGNGVANAEFVCEAVAKALHLPGGAESVLPSSTGIIGWRLPAEELAKDVVPIAVQSLQSDSAFNAARDIITTDRYPKLRSKTLSNGARIVGVAKGAGMIEPNMSTMLCYVMTDTIISKSSLQSILSDAVDQSFNSISVDGDESTSDTTVLLSSNKVAMNDNEEIEFKDAVFEICRGLAADLVRNGEGTGHVMRVQIKKFPGSNLEARRLGRHIVNSPLFKCAVSGNDPNTGRLAGAIGSFMGKFKNEESVENMEMTIGGRTIFSNGKFVLEGDKVERELSEHMKAAQQVEDEEFPRHQRFVEIGIDFGTGSESATVLGSDLTNEYIKVNADYRS